MSSLKRAGDLAGHKTGLKDSSPMIPEDSILPFIFDYATFEVVILHTIHLI